MKMFKGQRKIGLLLMDFPIHNPKVELAIIKIKDK